MEISTKFNIGDGVYFMHNNTIHYDFINQIEVIECKRSTFISYFFPEEEYDNNIKVEEQSVFKTKVELIRSL